MFSKKYPTLAEALGETTAEQKGPEIFNMKDEMCGGIDFEELITTVIHNSPDRSVAAIEKTMGDLLQRRADQAWALLDSKIDDIQAAIKKETAGY